MRKIILLSILVANIAIPLWAAREKRAGRGLRKAILAMLIFNVVYLGALLIVYPHL